MTYLEELQEKRKNALIIVCTLGLTALFMERFSSVWTTNLFEGTSFMQNGGVAFICRIISFLFLSVLLAGIFWIINVFKLIYYSIEIARQP